MCSITGGALACLKEACLKEQSPSIPLLAVVDIIDSVLIWKRGGRVWGGKNCGGRVWGVEALPLRTQLQIRRRTYSHCLQ